MIQRAPIPECITCQRHGACICWDDSDEREFQEEFEGDEAEDVIDCDCAGSGDCATCDGEGMVGTQYEDESCEDCNGSGVCPECNGYGE